MRRSLKNTYSVFASKSIPTRFYFDQTFCRDKIYLEFTLNLILLELPAQKHVIRKFEKNRNREMGVSKYIVLDYFYRDSIKKWRVLLIPLPLCVCAISELQIWRINMLGDKI